MASGADTPSPTRALRGGAQQPRFPLRTRAEAKAYLMGDSAPDTFVSPASRGPRRVFFDLDEVRAFLRLNPELPGDDMVVGPPLMVHETGADATLRRGKWVLG